MTRRYRIYTAVTQFKTAFYRFYHNKNVFGAAETDEQGIGHFVPERDNFIATQPVRRTTSDICWRVCPVWKCDATSAW